MLAAAFLGTVAAASVGAPGASTQVRQLHASRSAALPLTITTRVDARGNGAFTLRGALVDSGRAAARRAVVNGRLVATITLVGANGGLVLTSRQPCGRGAGRWRIVSGTRAYAGVAGHGATSAARCRRPLGPAAVVFRGSVEVPPARLAPPGPYGGQTTQDASFLFEVTPDGRTVANVLLGQFRYECVRSDGSAHPWRVGRRHDLPRAVPDRGRRDVLVRRAGDDRRWALHLRRRRGDGLDRRRVSRGRTGSDADVQGLGELDREDAPASSEAPARRYLLRVRPRRWGRLRRGHSGRAAGPGCPGRDQPDVRPRREDPRDREHRVRPRHATSNRPLVPGVVPTAVRRDDDPGRNQSERSTRTAVSPEWSGRGS